MKTRTSLSLRWAICCLAGVIATWNVASEVSALPQSNATLRVKVDGKTHVGKPIAWDDFTLMMLRRDGRMLHFPVDKVADSTKVSETFAPYNSSLIQEHLKSVFTGNYSVTRTRHYVVVHAPGQEATWAAPFEELYGRFHHYFRVRGFTVREPEFPMVVVVFNSRGEFNAVAANAGMNNPNQYVGFYSPTSNWVVTFKQSGDGLPGRWESNNLTLIHEALHQFAFNTGVHNRWAPTPTWCSEGLAVMFETRGVNHNQRYSANSDRLHQIYLPYLKNEIQAGAAKGLMLRLVSSDRLFQETPDLAYALSWGLAHYLTETRPGKFHSYLQLVAARDSFQEYTSNERLEDFAQYFGSRLDLLEAQFHRYLLEQ